MPFPYTQQTWTDGVSSASAARLAVIEAGVALAGVTGTSSTPPASPTDGMIWRFPADSANGVYWFFQYDSSQATFKWVAMGAQVPMYASVLTSETTASAAYVALATAGPSITVARQGDYDVTIGSRQFDGTAATVMHSYDIGGTGAVDADAFQQALVINQGSAGSWVRRKTAIAAATALVSKYKTSAGTASFANRFMAVTPVRVI